MSRLPLARASICLRSAFAILVILAAHGAAARNDSLLVRVSPSGGDDTATLQAALNRCVGARVPCTVQLAAGRYLTRQLVATDFHGTFEGAGRRRTIISPIGTLRVCEKLCPGNPDTTTNLWPSLIVFIDGDVTIANLSLVLDKTPGTTPWEVAPGVFFNSLLDGLRIMGSDRPMKATMRAIAITGARDDSAVFWWGMNTINCTGIAGELLKPGADPNGDYQTERDTYPLTGTFTVSESSFDTCFAGIGMTRLYNSTVVLGGAEQRGDVVSGTFFGLDIENFENSRVEISYNSLSSSRLADLIIFYPKYAGHTVSHYSIHDNLILSEAEGGADGIFLVDNQEAPKVIDAKIVHNIARASAAQPLYGMIHPIFTTGTLIAGNELHGAALWGIALEGVSDSAVLGNSVGDVQAELARIWLDGSTTRSLVAGQCSPGDVLNEGTRNLVLCSSGRSP